MKPQKTLLTALLIGLSVLVAHPALAHGDSAPKHGGIVQAAHDLAFELVSEADGASLYVEDHGEPYDASGARGKLTVLNAGQKSDTPLLPAGANRLQAKGIALAKGAKVVAVLTTADKKTVSVRFSLP